jgi:hypothetical protein
MVELNKGAELKDNSTITEYPIYCETGNEKEHKVVL